ncbi:hypothetical protein HK101_002039 [Irineochytrium annulatum]|nr:hypothetical protein HK101_002039 [Irineochytrium annulatum]
MLVLHVLAWWGYYNDTRPHHNQTSGSAAELVADPNVARTQGAPATAALLPSATESASPTTMMMPVQPFAHAPPLPMSRHANISVGSSSKSPIVLRDRPPTPPRSLSAPSILPLPAMGASPTPHQEHNLDVPAGDEDEDYGGPKIDGIYRMLSMKKTVITQQDYNRLSKEEKKTYKNDLRHTVDDSVANIDGMTPFLVAVKQKRGDMVAALLEFKATTDWVFGPVRKKWYNMLEIDTFVDKNTMNHTLGGLEIAVKNKDVEIIGHPIFFKLLEMKWKLYAKRIFVTRFALNLLYMLLVTTAIGLMPNGVDFYPPDQNLSTFSTGRITYVCLTTTYADNSMQFVKSACRLIVEILIVMANVYSFVREIKEMRTFGKAYFNGFGAIPNLIQWISMILFVMIVLTRAFLLNQAENILLGLISIFGWISLLYFTKGSKTLGPLTVIFAKVIKTDLVYFVTITFVFVAGFSNALYLQVAPYAATQVTGNQTVTSSGIGDWTSIIGSYVWIIRYMFQEGSYDDLRNTGSTVVRTYNFTLFLLALLIFTILLVNVFIAMLGSTFQRIFDKSVETWRVNWAELIMEIDERILKQHGEKREEEERRREAAEAKKTGPPTAEEMQALARFQARSSLPVTRIGVAVRATVVKPYTRVEYEKSMDDRNKSRHKDKDSRPGPGSIDRSTAGRPSTSAATERASNRTLSLDRDARRGNRHSVDVERGSLPFLQAKGGSTGLTSETMEMKDVSTALSLTQNAAPASAGAVMEGGAPAVASVASVTPVAKKEWSGIVCFFIVEFIAGQKDPVAIEVTHDKNSPLYDGREISRSLPPSLARSRRLA